MTLTWTGGEQPTHTAHGTRGTYVITRRWPGSYILTAHGHDRLPFLDMNVNGREYPSLTAAQAAAEHLDAKAPAGLGCGT